MRDDISERFATMWRTSREDAGKSQEYMAKALGVSRKTVQNWESGYSCPNQLVGFKWFEILKLSAMPYYLELLYPANSTTRNTMTDTEVENMLIAYLKGLRPADKRKLLFVIYGEHGSKFTELIEMLVAHFHTPDANRITIAQNICTNFEVATATNTLIATEHIMPDINILKRAIIKKRDKILGTHDGDNI